MTNEVSTCSSWNPLRKDIAELVDYSNGEETKENLIELEALEHLIEEEKDNIEDLQKYFMVLGLNGVFSKFKETMFELKDKNLNTEYSKII